MKIRITKAYSHAKLPVRAHKTDAGMDLFYCPEDNETNRLISPRCSSLLSTGLKIEVPPGYMLEIKNKGGVAAKRSLLVGSCVVDEGYLGIIFVNLHNVGRESQSIKVGTKIAQGIFVKIETDIEFVESESIYDEETDRGTGALGSTGDS